MGNSRWSVELVNGEYEIRNGSHLKATNPDYDSALRWLRGQVDLDGGGRIIFIEPDGYRMDITRRLLRRTNR